MMSGGKLKEFELWKNFSKIINNCLLVVNLSKSEDRSFHFLVKYHECRSSTYASHFSGRRHKSGKKFHVRWFRKKRWKVHEKSSDARKNRRKSQNFGLFPLVKVFAEIFTKHLTLSLSRVVHSIHFVQKNTVLIRTVWLKTRVCQIRIICVPDLKIAKQFCVVCSRIKFQF